jgi:eukaryotic-like serine/threonine-protein kinase
MTPEKWQKVKVLFEAVLGRPAERRLQFISENEADENLRAEVVRLLSNLSEAGSITEEPVGGSLRLASSDGDRAFFAPGKLLVNRFKIVRFLASGGMGQVYEAEDVELRERVAVKVVRPELLQDETALQRFKREVHLAKKVTHPNVCRVFDLFRHRQPAEEKQPGENLTLVSMELLKGETLAARIRARARFTPEEALPIVSQIAGALDAAHEAGVVHRDLKPGNIVLLQAKRTANVERSLLILALPCASGRTRRRALTSRARMAFSVHPRICLPNKSKDASYRPPATSMLLD